MSSTASERTVTAEKLWNNVKSYKSWSPWWEWYCRRWDPVTSFATDWRHVQIAGDGCRLLVVDCYWITAFMYIHFCICRVMSQLWRSGSPNNHHNLLRARVKKDTSLSLCCWSASLPECPLAVVFFCFLLPPSCRTVLMWTDFGGSGRLNAVWLKSERSTTTVS